MMANSRTMPTANNDRWLDAATQDREAMHPGIEVLGGIKVLGDQYGKNSPQPGSLGNSSQPAAQTLFHHGQFLEGADLNGMIKDFVQLARENSLSAVDVGIGFSWFVGSQLRRR